MLSIIIPTYNGEKKICNLLHSLEKQTFKDFEVIVVIDGSTDNTKKLLEQKNFDFKNFKVIFQENKGRSGSRNTGAKAASGDLLLFLDDDMRLPAESVQQHVEFHKKKQDEKIILVGNQIEELAILKTDIQRYKYYKSKLWANTIRHNKPMQPEQFFLTAANFSISKTLFLQLGGFDEALTDAEDYDLGKKALEKGIQIYFKPEIIGWHDDFITCRSYIRRQQQYQKAHQRLRELYPERYQYNQYDYKPAKGIKKMIYRFFAGNFWVNVVDKFNFLVILPKKLRYKLYDLIITANAVHFPLKR